AAPEPNRQSAAETLIAPVPSANLIAPTPVAPMPPIPTAPALDITGSVKPPTPLAPQPPAPIAAGGCGARVVGGLTEPVMSNAGAVGIGGIGATGVGAIRLALGTGAMSVSAADWRFGSGAA